MHRILFAPILVITFAWTTSAQVPAELILKVDATPAGAPGALSALGLVQTTSSGAPVIPVSFEGGGAGLWVDGAFRDISLSGQSVGSTGGAGDDGQFAYVRQGGGPDVLVTHQGTLMSTGTTPPGQSGLTVTELGEVLLRESVVYWKVRAETSADAGSEERWALYKAADAGPVLLAAGGQSFQGMKLTDDGVGDYDVSDNGVWLALVLNTTNGEADTPVVWAGGQVQLSGGDPAQGAAGDLTWKTISVVSVNDAGGVLIGGAYASKSGLLAYNGTVALQADDPLDAQTLNRLLDAALNTAGGAVHAWDTDSGKHIFYAADATDLKSSIRLLGTTDELDTTGDGGGDSPVTALGIFNTPNLSLNLANDGNFYTSLRLQSGIEADEAVVKIHLYDPQPTGPAQPSFTTTDEPAGANCPTGGLKLDIGLDTNHNQTLDADEITATEYLCNGPAGTPGDPGDPGDPGNPGDPGYGTLVDIKSLNSGDASCPTGGVQLKIGIDNGDGTGKAGDGVLQPDEIDITRPLCNGEPGQTVSTGTCTATPQPAPLKPAILALLLLTTLATLRTHRRSG